MLHEKKLLEQFTTQDKRPLSAPNHDPGEMRMHDSWELFNIGMGLLSGDMELVSYNSAFCHLTNLPAGSVLQSNLYGLLGIKASLISGIRIMLESDGSWSGKIRLGDRSLRIAITGLRANDPAILENPLKPAWSVTLVDCSEDFRQLQLLSEAKFQAEKTDRAKSQFLSHMSHELRTPLNAILGFAQLLAMDETLNDMQLDNVREIEGAGEYLLSLINEILDLSRIEAGKIELIDEEINFDHLVSECFMLVKKLADSRHVRLDSRLQDACVLRNDHVRLKQILINLLSNAIKYNRPGGSVLLQCAANESSQVRIEIVDGGNGIDKELLPCIFSPFERLGADTRQIEGTGIGLMITRRLVKLMKGDIGVISRSGAGSIFWMDLPVIRQQENSILARGEQYSSLFNPTPVFGFGPAGTRAFNLIEDLCSIRTTLVFRQDTHHEHLAEWLLQHQRGHVAFCTSMLASLQRDPGLQMMLNKFALVVVNDEPGKLAAVQALLKPAPVLDAGRCTFADLPMVLLPGSDFSRLA